MNYISVIKVLNKGGEGTISIGTPDKNICSLAEVKQAMIVLKNTANAMNKPIQVTSTVSGVLVEISGRIVK
jgi:hypothetical protein